MSNTLPQDYSWLEDLVKSAALQHHCLSCDYSYCASVDELPNEFRSAEYVAAKLMPKLIKAIEAEVERAELRGRIDEVKLALSVKGKLNLDGVVVDTQKHEIEPSMLEGRLKSLEQHLKRKEEE